MADVNEASMKLVALRQGESTFIYEHEVTFDKGLYKVATDFGSLNFYNPDDAARYCICVILNGESKSKGTEELKGKYDKIEKHVENLEAKIAPNGNKSR
jgi:hypothetical protein